MTMAKTTFFNSCNRLPEEWLLNRQFNNLLMLSLNKHNNHLMAT